MVLNTMRRREYCIRQSKHNVFWFLVNQELSVNIQIMPLYLNGMCLLVDIMKIGLDWKEF